MTSPVCSSRTYSGPGWVRSTFYSCQFKYIIVGYGNQSATDEHKDQVYTVYE